MNNREQPTKYISVLRGVYNRLEKKAEELEKEKQKLEEENQGLKNSLEKCGTHIEVIEKELRRLENKNQTLKERLYKVQYLEKENSNLFGENQKLKKALKILEDKTIHFPFLKRTRNVEIYNKHSDTYNYDELTQEEYELLKEVLGND